MPTNIDQCVRRLDTPLSKNLAIKGPYETIYGYGYMPTITYWIGSKRLHLYEDWNATLYWIEVADRQLGIVKCAQVSNIDLIVSIFEQFLCQGRTVSELTGLTWDLAPGNQDKDIPDPPDAPNPANIANLTGGYGIRGCGVPASFSDTTNRPLPRPRFWWEFWK